MRFELITTEAMLEKLRPQWDELLARVPQASPFMSWTWQTFWWRHYGAGHALRVIAVWAPSADGDALVAIWPLHIRPLRQLRGLVPLRVLQPVGVGGDTTPEYLDPLALPEQALELAPLLADFVLQLTGWDELRVPDLRAEFPFHAALEHASRRRGLPVQVLPVSQLCYVTLPESWPAYLASLSGDRRQKLKWMRKKFMELPGARFYALAERERLDAVIDRLIELHHMRWHGRGTQAFSSSAYLNFHRDVMHGFWDAGHLRLYCLEVDGAIAMIFYCYSLGGIIYHMQTGFDPAWSKSSPGHVMIGCLIENAISEGARGFDMLAGQNAFKLNYAREVRATRTVVVARSWKARLTFTARAIRTRLRRGPPAPAAD